MKISNKKLNFILFVIIFAAFLFAVSLFYHVLFFISIPILIGMIFLIRKICRCPHCGTFENLDRLLYAKNHIHHCRGCGVIIEIDQNN